MTLPVNPFLFMVKDILIQPGRFKLPLITTSGNPSGPREVHLMYQLNWGMDIALRRSDMVRMVNCHQAIIIVT